MEEHQRRVIEEKFKLDEKLDKLSAFFATTFFEDLDDAEKDRMKRQAVIMGEYSEILQDRINAF
jgi:hypothetical protein